MPYPVRAPSGLWHGFATSRRVIPAILLIAIALRLGLILAFPIAPRGDSLWYLIRGREIAQGLGYQEAGFPTAFWPVGYPALLGLATALFGPSLVGPILVNLIAQAATLALILWFARHLGAGAGAARLAALLYAVYPAHIAYSGDTAAEPSSTAIVMAGTALMLKARGRIGPALLAGVVLGAGALMRPQMMLFPVLLALVLPVAWRGHGVRRAGLTLALVLAGMAAVLLPWSWRNQAMLGAPVLVSSNGGVALHAGANDLADGGYFQVERSPLWDQVGIPFAQRVERQMEMERRLKTLAIDWIAAHPLRWGLLGLRKMGLLWWKDSDGFWPLDASHPARRGLWRAMQGVNQLFYLAVLALGLVGTGRAARAAWRGAPGAAMLIPAAMPVFCTVLAFGFTGQTRYHYPAMPFVMILAGWVAASVIAGATEPSRPPAAIPDHGR